MAFTERYANFDLVTGLNDGTTEPNAWQTPADVIANVSAGDRVNIKQQATAYDLTTTLDFNVSGTATAPIYYRGYLNTIGDGGLWEILYNSGGIANLQFSGAYNIIEGISFKAGVSSNLHAFNVNGTVSWCIRCDVTVTSQSDIGNMMYSRIILGNGARLRTTGANAFGISWYYNRIERTGATSSNSHLIITDQFGRVANFIGNTITGNGISGEEGLFVDRANDGRGTVIKCNKFYNFNSGIVIDEEPNATREDIWITNNVFSVMAEYGIERVGTEAGYVKLMRNFYHSVTSGFTNYAEESAFFDNTALSASPFTTPGSDFTINDTANGGVVMRAAGFAINEPYYWDNMADQAVFEGGAGGGGLLLNPGMQGGLNG